MVENKKFASGPTRKRKGWNPEVLDKDFLGRNHRAQSSLNTFANIASLTKEILNIPDDFKIGLLPGSATGAMVASLWSIIGAKKVDVVVCEAFGQMWLEEVKKLTGDYVSHVSDYGEVPNIKNVNFAKNDVVYVTIGTTGGVLCDLTDAIPKEREGLIIADMTCSAFSDFVDWSKVDVAIWSGQKVLSAEPMLGTVCLSPRALERLKEERPRDVPRIFDIRAYINNRFNGDFSPINSYSVMLGQDMLDAIRYFKDMGGISFAKQKINENYLEVKNYIQNGSDFSFFVEKEEVRAKVVSYLKFPKEFYSLNESRQSELFANFHKELELQNIAFDIKSYEMSPKGIRVWCGPSIEKNDILEMLPRMEALFKSMLKSYL